MFKHLITGLFLSLSVASLTAFSHGHSQATQPHAVVAKLHKAIQDGDLDTVKSLLASDPDLLEKRNEVDYTPLFTAVRYNQTDILKFLIDSGANINATESYGGNNPLQIGIFLRKPEAVRMLLDYNADAFQEDKCKGTALSFAAMAGSFEFTEVFMYKGMNVNAPDCYKVTPLMWAAWGGNIAVVKLLLENRANPLAKNAYGLTALDYAGDQKPEVRGVLLQAMEKRKKLLHN